MTHHKLETAELWNETVRQQNKAFRKEQNRLAIRGFFQFLFVLGVMGGCLYALSTMPQWLPTVEAFMNENGITDKLRAFQSWVS